MRKVTVATIIAGGLVWAYLLTRTLRTMAELRGYGVQDLRVSYPSLATELVGLAASLAVATWLLRTGRDKAALTVAAFSLFAALFVYLIKSASATG